MTQSKTHTPHRNSRIITYSPKSKDSPSRQLMLDLERALGQIQLHETELQKVGAFKRRSYIEDLDAHDLARTQADIAALNANSARHDAVRREAEAELHKHFQEVEEARRRKEEEEARLKREREAREKAERERREREEAERRAQIEREKAAAAKKAAEERAKAEAEEAKRKEREETAVREKAEKERLAKEASDKEKADQAVADEKAAHEASAQKAAQDAQAQAQPGTSASSNLEDIHSRYLELHKKLKKFRTEFAAAAKQDPQLKPKIGDMRRALRTSVGQLTDDKASNKKPTDRVKTTILDSLRNIPSPPVQLQSYLPFPLADPNTTIPALTLYLLSNFAKTTISQFASECAVNPRAAEPIGTLAAQIFSLPDLQFPLPSISNTSPPPKTSLIAVLICKYHAICPQLFGINTNHANPPNTTKGRLRTGWRREGDGSGDSKFFISEQKHLERMTGLGAGFASIALRNFSKTRLSNPYPPVNFWAAMSCLTNTAPAHVSPAHLVLMKNMIDGGWERIVLFWGNAGVAALREGCIAWPARLPSALRDSPAGRGLGLMVDLWEKEKEFRLV